METVLLVITIGLTNVFCFILGAKVVEKVYNNQPIEINPIKAVNKAITEHKETKAKEAEDEYYEAIMHNIDNYTGDSIGQVEIPKRK